MIESNQTPILEETDKSDIYQNSVGLSLFDEMRNSLPLSIYDIQKKFKVPYSSLKYFLEYLQKAKMLKSEIKITLENRTTRIYSLNQDVKNENANSNQ